MKKLKLILIVLAVFTLGSCGNYLNLNDISATTWNVSFDWDLGSSGSQEIYFYTDGTTDWGGTWTQDGKDVSWTFTSGSKTATYTGKVKGDHMSGTCSNTTGDSGTWEADII